MISPRRSLRFRESRTWRPRRRRLIRRYRSGSTMTPRRIWASRCSRSVLRCARCSQARRSLTGWDPTRKTTRSTYSCPERAEGLPPTSAISICRPTSAGPTASCAWCLCARWLRSSKRRARRSSSGRICNDASRFTPTRRDVLRVMSATTSRRSSTLCSYRLVTVSSSPGNRKTQPNR